MYSLNITFISMTINGLKYVSNPYKLISSRFDYDNKFNLYGFDRS